jgi:4-methyl-5(b-hydroxyethyl)-thiazole monophosphate biosynthesis
MPKVLVCISTDFEEIETVTIIDVLRRAKVEVVIATINNILTVGANSIVIQANQYLKDINALTFDMIVLPGGGLNTQNLASSSLVKKILQNMKKNDKYICAICAAAYILHCADVLNDEYTCYPSFEEKINSSNYIKTKSVVIDKKVITSKEPATTITFALELVKTLTNEQTYLEIKNNILEKNSN